MRKTAFLLGVSFLFLISNCTRSTAPLYRDGRIFAKLDSPPELAGDGRRYLTITAEVEGYEPFVTRIFDFDWDRAGEYMKELGITKADALNWNDYYGKKLIDLTGRELKGGSEVEVTVRQTRGHSQSASVPIFRVDGKTIVRVYYATSVVMPGGVTQLRIERIQ
ncbi:MAG: hypothetical protein B1H40_03955 [Candidatus Latescibacteria bacterium 4484_181]|nr:MAG: hypothetical protein B1H40_03955 [Candidatus Latescibacteria bacterium 4484_181]RKY73626.1 MAG: hypothetical protein DRQ24_02045 [Candidatus Latescibacterota bacterium]HDN67809.1 hypothetical protein [Bacillota bacterium]